MIVRILVKYGDKFGGSLVDTEIAGKRTMISFRLNLKIEKFLLRTKGVNVKNVKISSLML